MTKTPKPQTITNNMQHIKNFYIFLVQKTSNFVNKIKKISVEGKNRIKTIFTNKTKVEEKTIEQKPRLILEEDDLRIVNNQVTEPTKTIITSLIITILLISQLTLVLSNAQNIPDRSVYNNPEAILTIELEDKIKTNTLDNLIATLPKNSRETRRYGITSMTGVVVLNKAEHGVNIYGEYTKQNLKKEYNKEVGSFLSKLEQVKEGEDKRTDKRVDNLKLSELTSSQPNSSTKFENERQELKADLARFSKWDIEATRYTYLFTDPTISSISLSGYKDVITKIKKNLENNKKLKIKTIQLTDIKEIEKQVKAIQDKIQKRIKEERTKPQSSIRVPSKSDIQADFKGGLKDQEQKITQEILAKEMEIIQKSIEAENRVPSQSDIQADFKGEKTVELTEQKVNLVNKILKDEPNKTKSYKESDLDKLPLTTQEKTMVKVLLKDYNTIPEHKKSTVNQTLIQASEVKENNLKTESNILEKSNSLVDGVVGGSVKAEARHIFLRRGWEIKIEWNQVGARLPKQAIEELEWVVGNWGFGGLVGTVTTLLINNCGAYMFVCGSISVFIYASYFYLTGYNRWQCSSNGVWIYRQKVPLYGPGPSNYYLRCW